MPHLIVHCAKGRSPELKKEIAEKMKAAIIDAMGVGPERVSVAFREIEKDGVAKLYHEVIYANPEELVIEPGYTVD